MPTLCPLGSPGQGVAGAQLTGEALAALGPLQVG